MPEAAQLDLPLKNDEDDCISAAALGRFLRLCVIRDGQTTVDMTMPSLALERLDEYLDEALQSRIQAQEST